MSFKKECLTVAYMIDLHIFPNADSVISSIHNIPLSGKFDSSNFFKLLLWKEDPCILHNVIQSFHIYFRE